MPGVVIIGYGNPLRSDDGLGWIVVDRLAGLLRPDKASDIQLLAQHQLTPELAEPVSRARLVVFVDACEGIHPGAVTVRPVRPQAAEIASFTHDLSPQALIELARSHYGSGPEAMLVTINGAEWGYSEELSAPVEGSLPAVIEEIQKLIRSANSNREDQS